MVSEDTNGETRTGTGNLENIDEIRSRKRSFRDESGVTERLRGNVSEPTV